MSEPLKQSVVTVSKDGEKRETWSSRLAFIFVTIGAAIGYGNIWRFPQLAYTYGGGAFFIPYILALFVVGIPLLILEISLGQVYQMGDLGAFGEISKRLRGIGIVSVMNGYFVVIYYCALIAWTLHALGASFSGIEGKWLGVTGSEAYSFFINSIIGMETLGEDSLPTRLVPQNVITLAITWVIIFCCVGFGVKIEGQITYVTMGLPIIMLWAFLGRAVTLEGAQQGIKAYIGEWDLSVLTTRPDVWSTAVSQIFFSLGVTFGIMTALGSHCERNAPAISNSFIIALCNSFYSFIAGFAVFAALGHLSVQEGVPISDLSVGGPGLMFGSFPVVLATLPGGVHWVRMLFVMLFLLGIDSAFALIEAALTVLQDARWCSKFSGWAIAGMICVMSFVFGLLYVTDAGLIFLDVVDFYVNFVMILVGAIEAIGAGWIYGIDKQIEKFGAFPVLLYLTGTMVSWTVGAILWFNLSENAMVAGWAVVAGAHIIMAGLILSSLNSLKQNNPEVSMGSLIKDFVFGDIFGLCDDFGQVMGTKPPRIWGIIMKHVLPPVLLVLFVNLASAKGTNGLPLFGNYGSYSDWPYQVLGIFCVALSMALMLVGVAAPDVFGCFIPVREVEDEGDMEMKDIGDIPIPEAAEGESNTKEGSIIIPLPEES